MQGVLTAGELMECLQELGLDQSPQVGGSSTGDRFLIVGRLCLIEC